MASSTPRPYKIGVALSGGGARGFAHVGALKAMEELGVKPEVIAGVSAGSVIAVLYAAGVPYDRMLKIFANMKFRDFCDFKMRGGGFFRIDNFKKHILKEIAPYRNLEDLPMPVHIGVTDLDNGVPVDLTSGPIGDAIMASCSIPILFQPVEIEGSRYIDGGVLKNLPAWTIREQCDTLIGVNCSPMAIEKVKNTVFEVGMRAYTLLLKAHQKEDAELCDLAIEIPEIGSYKVFNLKEIQQVYIRGYASAKQRLKQWDRLDNIITTL